MAEELLRKEMAVLSLLNEGPKYGYELEKTIKERYMRYWTEMGFSSIYHILGQLEKKGLVNKSTKEGEHSTRRKVFEVTAKGRKKLIDSSISLFSSMESIRVPYLLSLLNVDSLPKKEVIIALRKRLSMIGEHKVCLKDATKPFQDVDIMAPQAITSWLSSQMAAEEAWIRDFIKELEE